jgi:hypothetical protein
MATAVFGSSIKKIYGETASLTTTALHLGVMPNYHEVMFYCASAWRLGLAPKLAKVVLYTGSAYVDYTNTVTDRLTTTHMPLDGMTTAKKVYLGTTAPTRGFYFTIDSSNKNAETATLDMEYCYDVSGYTSTAPFLKIEGTVASGFTAGETVTGGTSAATATCVYDDASTYLVVKDVSGGGFQLAETITGSSGSITTVTAINTVARGTAYFTDVASDSDGTDSPGATLNKSGLYAFTLPSVKRGSLVDVTSESLYWYRFTPSATLSTTIDIQEIYPACDTTNYGYMEAGTPYQFSMNLAEIGAFEFDHASSATLDINWVMH